MMKKLVVLTALALGFTVPALADVFSDFDKIVRQLTDSSSGRVYNGVFSVVNEDSGLDTYTGSGAHGPAGWGAGSTVLGYNPGDTIIGATVSFGLWDNDSAKEQVSFSIGGVSLGSSPGNQISGYNTFSYDLFSVLSASALDTVLADLADGTIDYRVRMANEWRYEDVWLKWASLDIRTETLRVPDGGATLALLGLGLLGVAFARRK
jgi:hypothetical protein